MGPRGWVRASSAYLIGELVAPGLRGEGLRTEPKRAQASVQTDAKLNSFLCWSLQHTRVHVSTVCAQSSAGWTEDGAPAASPGAAAAGPWLPSWPGKRDSRRGFP